MRRHMVRALAGTACAALLATPATADFVEVSPPVTVIEPGLDEPVPPLLTPAELLAQQITEAAAIAADLNARWNNPTCFAATGVTSPYSASGTTVTKNGPPNLGALTSACFGPGVAFVDFTRTTTRRTITTVVGNLIDHTGGTPPGFILTARAPGVTPLTANATTLDDASDALVSAVRAATGRRYGAGLATLTGGGPLVLTDTLISERLTQRDTTYVFEYYVGPGPHILTGDILGCDTPTGCYGGIFVPDIPGPSMNIAAFDVTLHITRTVERTLSAGTSFYDLALIALPAGTVHTAAAGTAFDTSDRLLRRLSNPPENPETGRWITWADAHAGRASYDTIDRDGWGLTFGFAYGASPDLTLGLALDFGASDLTVADPLTPETAEAESWQIAAHALYRTGRFHLSGALAYGEMDTDTNGSGLSFASYTPSFTGGAVEGGYALIDGPFRLTAEAGVTLLSVDLPSIEESGAAPLSVTGDSFSQTRAWAGLSARMTGETFTGKIHVRAIDTSGDEIITLAAADPALPGDVWIITGPDMGGTALGLGGDVTVTLAPGTTLGLAYEGRFIDDTSVHDGRLSLSIKW